MTVREFLEGYKPTKNFNVRIFNIDINDYVSEKISLNNYEDIIEKYGDYKIHSWWIDFSNCFRIVITKQEECDKNG